jgi:AAA ATPase domain/Tetratricopeptide repeat
MVMMAIRKNPYIIGRPVNGPDRFFNREKLLDFVADNLDSGARAIILHGQRRIGKSSVLGQIPVALADKPYTFIQLSLEGKSQKSLAIVLHELAKETLYTLEDELNQAPLVPTIDQLEENPEIFVTRFLKTIHKLCDQKDLVLLLDEFDTLGDYHPESAIAHLFPYIQSFLNAPNAQFSFLRIVPVVGRRLDDLPTLSRVFHGAPTWEIRLLDRSSATALITEPARDVLAYSEDAIEAMFDVCAGHPYFTQVMGFAVFSHARQAGRWTVHAADVHQVVDRAIELGSGGLAWFWDGLPIAERVLYSAACEIAARSTTGLEVKDGEPLEYLEDHGIMLTECLHNAQVNLINWKFLQRITQAEPDGVKRGSYRITIQLVQRWLSLQHPIRDEIWQLQDLEPNLKSLYEEARKHRNHNELADAIRVYDRIYAENPNHLGTLFDLADCCLQTHAYARALELFDRAYYVDPSRAWDGLLRSGLGHAITLRDQNQLKKSQNVLERLVEIDPDNNNVTALLAELQVQQLQPQSRDKSWGRFVPEWKWNLSKKTPPIE